MVARGRIGFVLLVLLLGPTLPSGSLAQEGRPDNKAASPATAKAGPAKTGVSRATLMDVVKQANPLLWPLALCSVVAVGYALERIVALRRSRVVPKEFGERFLDRLSAGKLDRERAAELCRANDSASARVYGRVVHYWGLPAASIREAISHDLAGEVVDMRRNVRVLNGTATLAPLLGLLGTVVGMIESFDALAGRTGGAGKGEALAHGISLALMTTAFGLLIAVVSVAAYYFLLNRIDVLVREIEDRASKAIDLVAGDSGRPIADRRPMGVPGDHARHEPMTRG